MDTDKGERLLSKNTLDFKSAYRLPLSERTALKYEMSGLFKQSTNRRIGRMYPRVSAYYKFEHRTTKFANFVNKNYAEKPTVFDEALCMSTAKNFQNFMRKKGYFNALCTYNIKLVGLGRVEVVYILDQGKRFTAASLEISSKDSTILGILERRQDESLIKSGTPLDGSIFDAEKSRITALLRNEGYALFIPNFIEFSGDSTKTSNVPIGLEVLPYGEQNNHPRYRIGNVTVYSSLVPEVTAIRSDLLFKGIMYFSNEPKFFIKPKHLDRAIKIRPGELYRQNNLDLSNRKMSTMGAFRFVSIRPKPDSLREDTMNVDIFFAPAKRMSGGVNFDFRYINTPGLLGIPLNVFFKHRNLFHGAELLQTNLIGNVEFNTSSARRLSNPIYQIEGRLQNDLTIPRFFDYLGLWRAAHAIHWGDKRVLSDKVYEQIKNDARAHIGVNANYLDFTDFYQSVLFDASFGYDLNRGSQKSVLIKHVGVDLLRFISFSSSFDSLKIANPFFAKSISSQLFTGFLFRFMNFAYYSKPNRASERWSFRLSSDISGAEISLLNKIFNQSKKLNLPFGVNLARYFRFETGGTYTRNFTKNVWAGINIGTGVIIPFGGSENTPYVKQFFVGGPSSIRAWQIRELGPGKFYPDQNRDRGSRTPFYQASDFKFEFSSELRFPIFSYFKGAVFVDGGNVWALKTDPERPGAALKAYSYQNIAIGTGIGLRFDFGYSVIRFDWGLKVRKPYLTSDNSNYWMNWRSSSIKDFNQRIGYFNIAVGYPF